MIAIDPGVSKGIGYAEFTPSLGLLICAELMREGDVIELLHLVPRQLVVIEFPRIYPAASQKGDQNDLLELARVCGRIEQAALAEGHTVEMIYPRDWKGTIDADVMVDRIQDRLGEGETAMVTLPSAKSLHDNVWDAVGIGLWKLGRLEPRKVFPR